MSGAPTFEAAALVPHPTTPSRAAQSIVVRLRREARALSLRYLLRGDIASVRIPAAGHAARVDGLWRHTCFELFIAPAGSAAYQEFNFSPSGDWAAYAFTNYREAGRPLECAPPAMALRTTQTALELDAAVAWTPRGRVTVGLSAVVEDEEGGLSYWALRHPLPQPDFHHVGSFVLEVDEIRH